MLCWSARPHAPAAEAQRRSQLQFSNEHLAEQSLPAELHLANLLQSRKIWICEARRHAFCVVQTRFATVEKSASGGSPSGDSGLAQLGHAAEPVRAEAIRHDEEASWDGRGTGSAEPCAEPRQALARRLRLRNRQGAGECAAGLAFSGVRRLDNGPSGEMVRRSGGILAPVEIGH
jgi:hypothetical protein